MKLLALDTATEACSAALLIGETLIARYEEPVRGHAERILPMVDAVLSEAGVSLEQLDAIAVGRGPGAFTGVRIAIGVAQGLAFGIDKPVLPVSDLAALAQRAVGEHGARQVVACIDARMNEVYWAHFAVGADGLVSPTTEEQLTAPEAVALPGTAGWFAAGTGWSVTALAARLGSSARSSDARLLPRATEIARLAQRDHRLGRAVPAETVQPVYLRDQVARAPSQKRPT